MQARLDLGSKSVAAQDFCHTVQGDKELVADFVLWLERIFRRAYGRQQMSTETKETLLYGQMHEGLRYSLMKAPAVSGAKSYSELCGAARSEERRQSELVKRQLYQREDLVKNSVTLNKKSGNGVPTAVPNKQQSRRSGERSELDMSNVKCFKCSQFGHIAKACPKRTSGSTRVIAISNDDTPSHNSDPWIRTLTESNCTASQQRGPVYKVNVELEGVRTRALLDHGAQVSLLRSQLLPVVKEKKGWTLDQCHLRNLKLDQQPVGAEGRPLGAVAMVQLQVKVESTGVGRDIPFYVLDSNKPIWNGELANCEY